MNTLILLIYLTTLPINYNQDDSYSNKLSFYETDYDFGFITNDKTVEHQFRFQNTSNDDLSIITVSTSCRCTSTQWPKSAIESQKDGIINVIFSTKGRSGYFKEYLHVYFSNNEHHVITISGTVDEESIQYSNFSLKYSPLLVEKEKISFGVLKPGEHQIRRIILYNPTVSLLKLKFRSNSEMLKINCSKDTLFPFDTSILTVNLNILEDCFGHKKLDAIYSINDTIIGSFPVNANVVCDVKQQDVSNSPRIQLSRKTKTIRHIKKTKNIHKCFTIRNTGKQPLCIYDIYTDNMKDCHFSKYIKPGRRTRVRIVLNFKDEENYIPIEIYSNAINAPLERMIFIIKK